MKTNKLKRRRRWHRLPSPLQDLVERVTDEHPQWSAAQILRDLCERNEDGSHKYSEVAKYGEPGDKTVQEIVKTSRPPDTSGHWEPTEWEDGEDVALVLEVVKYLQEVNALYGSHLWLTRAEADRILWVRKVAPTLWVDVVWRVIRRYIAREAGGQPTRSLALYLAFKPWESEESLNSYLKSVPVEELFDEADFRIKLHVLDTTKEEK